MIVLPILKYLEKKLQFHSVLGFLHKALLKFDNHTCIEDKGKCKMMALFLQSSI